MNVKNNQRLVHRYRTEQFPHNADGIQINACGWRFRIGWFAANWKFLPSKTYWFRNRLGWQLRVGKIAIAGLRNSSMNS